MTLSIKNGSQDSPSYHDFEPHCELQRDERQETLVLHLPEFKRDQLKVQVNNLGVLKISGERPLDGDHGSKKSRFYKETVLSPGYDINAIRAKFSSGYLHVTMPKKSNHPPPPAALQPVEQTRPAGNIYEPDDHKVPSSATRPICRSSGGGGVLNEPPSVVEAGTSIDDIRMTVGKKVAVGAGVAIAVVVAMGVYVAFKYHSSSPMSPSHSSSTSDYL